MDPTNDRPTYTCTYVYDAEGSLVRIIGGTENPVATYTYDQYGLFAPEADEPIYREDERKPPEDDEEPPG